MTLDDPTPAAPRHWQWAVAGLIALLLVGSVVHFAVKIARDPETIILRDSPPARWIVYPTAEFTGIRPRATVDTQFRRTFQLASRPAEAALEITALRRFEVRINGAAVSLPPATGSPPNWKTPTRLEVAPLLRLGTNEIAVRVWNGDGPPALRLTLALPDRMLASDEAWRCSLLGATELPARLVAARPELEHLYPARLLPRPFDALRSRWIACTVFAVLSGAVLLLWTRIVPAAAETSAETSATARAASPQWLAWWRRVEHQPWLVLMLVAVVWTALFVNNRGSLPALFGFDSDGHLEYIQFLLDEGRVPLPNEGWEMFQPPLYYVLSAGLLKLAGMSTADPGALDLLRVQSLLFGLAQLLLVLLSLRLVLPDRPGLQIAGVLLAGFLPMQLYLFQYVTNEAAAGTLSSLGLYLALRLSRQQHWSTLACARLGACLGLALLMKVSALMIVAVILVVMTAQLFWQRSRLTEFLRTVGLAMLVMLLVCGWRFGDIWSRYGTPFVGNWDPVTSFAWWQDPGCRSVSWCTTAGRALVEPYGAGFDSLWDSLYATLFGDTMLGGMTTADTAPPWNYEWISAGMGLALLPALGMLCGLVLFSRDLVRRPTPAGFLMCGSAFAVLLALVSMSFVLPSYAVAKSFYGLSAIVPLCVFGARGLAWLAGLLRGGGWIIWTAFGAWLCASLSAYWISGSDDVQARLLRIQVETQPATPEILDRLSRLQQRIPQNIDLGRAAAALQMDEQHWDAALDLYRDLIDRFPDSPVILPDAARAALAAGRRDIAQQQAEAALRLNRHDHTAWQILAQVHYQQQRPNETIVCLRECLRIHPTQADAHALLARLYQSQGRLDEAQYHTDCRRRFAGDSPRGRTTGQR